jgi:hypothetical protein
MLPARGAPCLKGCRHKSHAFHDAQIFNAAQKHFGLAVTPARRHSFKVMAPDTSYAEKHYRVGELAELWKLGRETVRIIVKDEPGVMKVRMGRKKAHTTYSVPESVAQRIHTRLLNSA